MRKINNIEKKVGLEYMDLLNSTVPSISGQMPLLHCNLHVYPDYLALYTEPGKYRLTNLTAVCFYQWDDKFDSYDGLLNSIKYNLRENLENFKKRFHGVKIFIAPDYSLVGNNYDVINYGRIMDARIVSLWFTNELNAIVIPNITYTDSKSFPMMIDGLKKCNVVAFSAMSCINNSSDMNRLQEAVKYTVDNLNLDAIIVYTSSVNDAKVKNLFQYATNKGIEIVIPDNSLRISNRRKQNG